jgi:hypothetical protein
METFATFPSSYTCSEGLYKHTDDKERTGLHVQLQIIMCMCAKPLSFTGSKCLPVRICTD